MDTNRLGNLKRFFSISDNDRVLDIPEEIPADAVAGKTADWGGTGEYNYIFWNRMDAGPDSGKKITLKDLARRLAKGGRLVVYFDNPCSVHNLSMGKLDARAVSVLSYPVVYKEIQNFCEETGFCAGWYYPYPNVAFPYMFFTDARLPAGGECDDNYYHFDMPAMEVFDEREAVDALTAGGMYPYMAHAYMVVLSAASVSDMPLYTRFSNERRLDKQIRTDLMKDCVKKTAVSREAEAHIGQMTGFEKKLGEILEGLSILGKPCEANRIIGVDEEEKSLSFAYVKGESLENILDRMLAEDRDEEVAEVLLDICTQIRNLESLAPFVVTDAFVEVFGRLPDDRQQSCSLDHRQWMSLPVTDIDMVCQNILLSDKAVVIDYEWTFAFPVPLDYLIFRFLYFYLEAKLRSCMERKAFANIYERAGIPAEDKEYFLAMETHFQRYVQQGAVVLRNEFDDHGAPLIPKEELEQLLEERNEQSAYVLYENGTKLPVRGKREKDGVSTFRIPVAGNDKMRFWFAPENIPRKETKEAGGRVFRIGAMVEKSGRTEGISFETTGVQLGGLLYFFRDGQVEIVPKDIVPREIVPEEPFQLLISIEEVKMTRAAREELVRTISDLRFVADNREQQLRDMKNSASWKVTKPLRRLKGNKEE